MEPAVSLGAGGCAACGGAGGSLEVLRELQRVYQQRLDAIDDTTGDKYQKQASLLRRWVRDLSAQNELLARAVEQLEEELATRLLLERRIHAEVECEARAEAVALRRQLACKHADLQGLLEVLRVLRDPARPRRCALADIHFNEVTQSDIFGPDLWQDKHLEQGDSKRASRRDHRLDKMTLL